MQAPATHLRRLAALLLALAVCLPVMLADAPPAIAQEGLSGTGIGKIFRKLRERFRRTDRRVVRKSRRKTGRKTSRRSRDAASAQSGETLENVEKLQNARTILVVGDFLAGGMAEGLETAFTGSPGVRVVERASGSSGFVRSDFYNWPASIGPIIDEEKPSVIVVMLGSNDRQSLYIVDRNEPVRSEAWLKEYESRVTAMANVAGAKRVPLIWVGMPSFKFRKMSADMLAFNDIYRSVAQRAGGSFVDIWDGFVDENNEFVRSGPDINGQIARLRSSDGINMTSAGKRKMAFYVEKPLRKLLGPAASPDIGVLGPQSLDAISMDPSGGGPAPGRTIPIALTDPALDGGIELLGGDGAQRPRSSRLPGEKLAIEGIAAEPKPGRADNFIVPSRQQPAVPTPPTDDIPTTAAIYP